MSPKSCHYIFILYVLLYIFYYIYYILYYIFILYVLLYIFYYIYYIFIVLPADIKPEVSESMVAPQVKYLLKLKSRHVYWINSGESIMSLGPCGVPLFVE